MWTIIVNKYLYILNGIEGDTLKIENIYSTFLYVYFGSL